jgi:hypothetical protein
MLFNCLGGACIFHFYSSHFPTAPFLLLLKHLYSCPVSLFESCIILIS